MLPREVFVPATVMQIHTYDPGEVRKIALTLPEAYALDGQIFPIRDRMRPGNAFLARPWGQRTKKYRRRMYTRSNCAIDGPRVLETIINDTHREKADTSPWWQTEAIDHLESIGGTIEVRVDVDTQAQELVIYENSQKVEPNNLILETDNEWPTMRILALAFSTGITPFLSYLDYMRRKEFGRIVGCRGVEFILVASVRNPRHLIQHEELQAIAAAYPKHFQYIPVLTREWPKEWEGGKGRIIKQEGKDRQEARINLDSLLDLVPNIHECHIRLCGNASARDQFLEGLYQAGLATMSFRSEVW